MNLFYHPEITPSLSLLLSEEESSHCIRVLRMKTGDSIFLTDGKGTFYEGEISSEHPKKCMVKIIRSINDTTKRNFHLAIAIAPTKNIDRFEWFLEKATEIGCDEIIPVSCHYSERTVIKTERLHKVITSAMKQCLTSQLPRLQELQSFKTGILSAGNFKGQKFIAHIPELTNLPAQEILQTIAELSAPDKQTHLQNVYKKGENVLIAIGPEGGFSTDEVEFAVQNGFVPVSLGNSRLRVETAGIVACSIIHTVNS